MFAGLTHHRRVSVGAGDAAGRLAPRAGWLRRGPSCPRAFHRRRPCRPSASASASYRPRPLGGPGHGCCGVGHSAHPRHRRTDHPRRHRTLPRRRHRHRPHQPRLTQIRTHSGTDTASTTKRLEIRNSTAHRVGPDHQPTRPRWPPPNSPPQPLRYQPSGKCSSTAKSPCSPDTSQSAPPTSTATTPKPPPPPTTTTLPTTPTSPRCPSPPRTSPPTSPTPSTPETQRRHIELRHRRSHRRRRRVIPHHRGHISSRHLHILKLRGRNRRCVKPKEVRRNQRRQRRAISRHRRRMNRGRQRRLKRRRRSRR